MNVLFFNRSFYPDIQATGQFLTELCEDLTEMGHHVTVIAGNSSFSLNSKNNKFLSVVSKEKYKSIDVLRVAGTDLPKNFLLFRLVNLFFYFFFAFTAGFMVGKKPNIIVAQTDPPVMGLLGYFFSKFYSAKFVYACKDIYPDVGIVTGRLTNPFLNLLLEKINLFSFIASHLITCLSEDMKNKIQEKGISSDKIIVIPDWADTKELYPVPASENYLRCEWNMEDFFTIMYSGNIGLTQKLEDVIEVANKLKENKKIMFYFVGDGASKINLQKMVQRYDLENVRFYPYQPKGKLKYSLSAPDIHLITFQKGLAGIVVPSKIYGIMACGKPFLAWVDEESDVFSFAKQFGCGVTVKPGDIDGMVNAILWCLKNPSELQSMGQTSRKAAIDYFERKKITSRFDEMVIDKLMI